MMINVHHLMHIFPSQPMKFYIYFVVNSFNQIKAN